MTRRAARTAFFTEKKPQGHGMVVARWAWKYGRPSWTIELRSYVEEAARNHGLGYVQIVEG